jgi:DNA-binding MarR family transcriptional regulator
MHGASAEEAAPSLNFHEQTVLLTLFAEPDQNVSDIVSALGLEQSWVSRIIASLEKRGLVKGIPSPTDRRSKQLKLTDPGREVLRKVDLFLAQVMTKMLEPLTHAERDELRQVMDLLADGLGSPRYVPREESHPFDVTMSRITSGIGILGESVFGSGLNNTQIQVFVVLHESSDKDVQISDIEQLVPYDMSTVSRTVAAFQKKGWVQKERSKADKRSFIISLSSAGDEKYHEYRRLADKFLSDGLLRATGSQADRAIELLQKLTTQVPISKGVSLEELISLERVTAEDGLEEIQHAGRALEADEQIFVASIDNNRKAVVRFKPSRYSKSFESISLSGSSVSLDELKVLLDKVFE